MSGQRPLFDPQRMAVAKLPPAGPAPAPPAAGTGPQAPAAPQLMTVTQLSARIRQVLGDHLPGTLHLVGEISNCCRHNSGHLYLTLKDDRSEIRAVMWKSALARIKFHPADGMEVIATGHVDVYENRGQYQFYIDRLEPRGTGALELAFRQLREKLERERLFEPSRKKPIPRFPRRIAVVTSPTGAAIRDILRTLQRRCRCVSVLLYPVRVQGEGAAQEIAAAITQLSARRDALGGIDTLIVARGGGSLEDLWAFNEEPVARAIAASVIPVISGVGHEVDVTIADLVADLRAATPTAAAEQAVPMLDEVLDALTRQGERLRRSVQHRLDLSASRLGRAEALEWFRNPLAVLQRREQALDEAHSRLRLTRAHRLDAARQRLHAVEVRFTGAHPRLWNRQRQRVDQLDHRLQRAIAQRMLVMERRAEGLTRRMAARSPSHQLQMLTHRVEHARRHLQGVLSGLLRHTTQQINGLAARIEAISHRATLARGFTITRTPRGKLITRAAEVRPGDRLVTETADGSFESRVSDTRQGELFE